METTTVYWGIGLYEDNGKMETTISGWGFRMGKNHKFRA